MVCIVSPGRELIEMLKETLSSPTPCAGRCRPVACINQRKILPTRQPDNIHVLIRKAALPALFRGSVREGDPFSIPYRGISP